MTNADDLLSGARPPEDTVPVCTRGDLVAEWHRLGKQLAEAKLVAAADPRVAGDGTSGLVERMEALRAEVETSTVPFRLRALPRRAWNALAEAHPPRKVDGGDVHPDDVRMGVNRLTFLPELVKRSTVEPTLRDETWEQLLDPDGELLTEQQWRRLWRACWNLNVQEMDVPFSVAGLLPSPTSDSVSGSPDPSV